MSGTVCKAAARQLRRSRVATPTAATNARATPLHMRPSAPGGEAEPIASVRSAVMIGEHQVRQTEHDRADEPHLECPDDVLLSRAEQRERGCGRGRDPGVDARASHSEPEQHGGDEVRRNDQNQVGPVARQAEDVVEHAPLDDRNRRPVPVVRLQQSIDASAVATGEERPLVAAKPAVPPVPENEQAGEQDHSREHNSRVSPAKFRACRRRLARQLDPAQGSRLPDRPTSRWAGLL